MDRPGKETGPSYSGGIWDEEMAQSAALLTSLHFCVERMMRFTNESETPTPVRPGPFPAPAGWAISRIHLEARSRSAGSRRQGSECYRLRDHRLAGSRREFNASEVVEETFADPLPIGMAWVWMQDPV